jgi:hypothetical protein
LALDRRERRIEIKKFWEDKQIREKREREQRITRVESARAKIEKAARVKDAIWRRRDKRIFLADYLGRE